MAPLLGDFVRKFRPILPLSNNKFEFTLCLLPCEEISFVLIPNVSNAPNALLVKIEAFSVGESFLKKFYSFPPPNVRMQEFYPSSGWNLVNIFSHKLPNLTNVAPNFGARKTLMDFTSKSI